MIIHSIVFVLLFGIICMALLIARISQFRGFHVTVGSIAPVLLNRLSVQHRSFNHCLLQYCNNVRHVSLPVVMTLSPDQLAQVGDAIQRMEHLHTLDVGWDGDNIKPLLLIGSKLQELTLYVRKCMRLTYDELLDEWMSVGFRPSKLNIVFTIHPMIVVQKLLQKWQYWNSKIPANHNAWLKIYSRLRTSLNLSPILPTFQLQFGQAAVLPLVQVKQCNTLGLNYLRLTDCYSDGMVYKATIPYQVFQ